MARDAPDLLQGLCGHGSLRAHQQQLVQRADDRPEALRFRTARRRARASRSARKGPGMVRRTGRGGAAAADRPRTRRVERRGRGEVRVAAPPRRRPGSSGTRRFVVGSSKYGWQKFLRAEGKTAYQDMPARRAEKRSSSLYSSFYFFVSRRQRALCFARRRRQRARDDAASVAPLRGTYPRGGAPRRRRDPRRRHIQRWYPRPYSHAPSAAKISRNTVRARSTRVGPTTAGA